METIADPLWTYALGVYARPGVADTCLTLQDEQGMDVNLLLLCLWCGMEGPGELDRPTLVRCLSAVHDWQRQVVAPLRVVRRRLKAGLPGVPSEEALGLRDAVAGVELQAEQGEQRLLARALAGLPPRPPGLDGQAATSANLLRYAELAGIPLTATVRARLDSLVAAARVPGEPSLL
jgi:uncharacterized protein (TIGR02444 family)